MSDNALQLNAIQPLAGHTARTSGIWRRCLLTIKLGLAGFTEEFFFRGVLQTRLARWLNSNWWAVIVTIEISQLLS